MVYARIRQKTGDEKRKLMKAGPTRPNNYPTQLAYATLNIFS